MIRLHLTSLLVLIGISAYSQSNSNALITDCGCDSLWLNQTTKEFVSHLEKTTVSNNPVWKNYDFGTTAFVLNAGQINDSTNCLGLWRDGKSISFKCSSDVPKMLTPLYSYYLNYENTLAPDSTHFRTCSNAPNFSAWMESNSIETAIYMPTDFPEFPFKIPYYIKTQLAVHEAFHVEVMLRYWYTGVGFWPVWDKQPDRSSIPLCYTKNESIQSHIQKEQETLALLIEALLDNKKPDALRLADTFLETRESRHNQLKGQQIELASGDMGDCETAEAFMEIEEGIADYASWVKMFDIGVISLEDLMKRYRAKQAARYYLTGCMLLHATVLMNNGDDDEILSRMVNANSVREGNLLTIFREQLNVFKNQ